MGEGQVCVELLSSGEAGNDSNSRIELKRDIECVVNEVELDASPCKKQAIEASNDDMLSEVSDPSIIFPRENENTSSMHTSSSQPGHLGSNNQVNSGEITSVSSGNSCLESSSDEGSGGDSSGRVSTSNVVLEIPEHAGMTGIRKITFKFSKSKGEYEGRPSCLAAGSLHSGVQEGESQSESHEMLRFDDSSDRTLYNMELKMSKKVVPDSYPTNVKKLLGTCILEGARVKYITTSREKEIPGIIKGCGYQCGCSTCNYTNVLSAYEFEQHAGGAKTRHPNNHIFLENGRRIYSIIEELKSAPLGMLEEIVKDMAGSSCNPGSFHAWKATLHQSNGPTRAEKKYKRKHQNNAVAQMRSNSSIAKQPATKKSAEGGAKKRDNDLHRLLFMPNGLPDGTELAYCAKGQKILGGYKQGNGIVCRHCNCEISPSQFEAHAGWAARRQPYRHICTLSGLTLHDIAISLANGQSISTGHNDDMCTVCGDRGDLIPCNGCHRAYHQACLGFEQIPEGDWHCMHCKGKKHDHTRPIIIRLTRAVKTAESSYGGCVICREHDFSVNGFDDRTVIICDQCEKEYHVGCLRNKGLCDLEKLPENKWFCCGDCNRIFTSMQDLFVRGSQAVPSSVLAKISWKLTQKGLSEIGENDVQWQILSGKNRLPEHLPLLSRAIMIFRECFSPIVASCGRDLIPIMVHGRNISDQEFSGMYCVVLTVKSIVVSAGLLRIFGREVAELPLVATSKEYQGNGYFQALFSCIESLLFSLNVQNLVLPAAETAKSLWINKLGFRDMNPEGLESYTRETQLTEFNGTHMLEKAVEQATD